MTAAGPPILLKPQAALFLTLVLHELSTNAAKYGALSAPGGRVEIAWSIAGDRPRAPGAELAGNRRAGDRSV